MCLRSPGRLRDHPKLQYGQHRAWPPQWVRLNGGGQALFATGEDGTLVRVELRRADTSLPERVVLLMTRETETYVGVLLVEDAALVPKLYERLQRSCGQTLREIGDLPLPE
jgi:hypothetical protein